MALHRCCRFAAVDPEHVCVDAFGAPLDSASDKECHLEARMQMFDDIVRAAVAGEVQA